MTKHTKRFNDVRSYSRDRLANPLWRGALIFLIGLVVGWFVFGWLLFPVKYTNAYPNELQPEVVNDYLLMTAESYAATGDLRTAAKRLRYWEPEELAVMVLSLAQSLETTDPAGAAYLQVLARDLHLSSAPGSSSAPPPASGFNFWWLLSAILALVVLVILIKIAQRFGWLKPRTRSQPEEKPAITEGEEVATPIAEVSPVATTPQQSSSSDQALALPARASEGAAAAASAAVVVDAVSTQQGEMPEGEEDETPETADEDESYLPEEAPDFPPHESADSIPEPDDAEPTGDSPTIDVPVSPQIPADEIDVIDMDLAGNNDQLTPKVLRFNGDPAYNTIVAIESNGDYLGEYGLSAGRPAPDNPVQVLTLEAWLFDKSDTQTTETALVPPVVATDPELKARYANEDSVVLPLKPGQIILLETAELRLEGRVRRVQFGPATREGVPVIEFAEIEMVGRRQ